MIKINKFILLIIASLLLIPFIAMQFTDEVNWTLFDFVIAGVLLLGAWLIFDLVLKKIKNNTQRISIIFVLIIFLLLIGVELAVGIFGTPIAGH